MGDSGYMTHGVNGDIRAWLECFDKKLNEGIVDSFKYLSWSDLGC